MSIKFLKPYVALCTQILSSKKERKKKDQTQIKSNRCNNQIFNLALLVLSKPTSTSAMDHNKIFNGILRQNLFQTTNRHQVVNRYHYSVKDEDISFCSKEKLQRKLLVQIINRRPIIMEQCYLALGLCYVLLLFMVSFFYGERNWGNNMPLGMLWLCKK